MCILSILVLRISNFRLFSVIISILALNVTQFCVCLHEFAPRTLQLMSVYVYLKFIYCGRIICYDASILYVFRLVSRYSILPFCFWVILWKGYNSSSQICVAWQLDSPIKVICKFWSAITLTEGCELKAMENNLSIAYISLLGSYAWLHCIRV